MPAPNTDEASSILTPLYNAHAPVGKRPLPSTTVNPTNRGAHPHDPWAQAPAVNTANTCGNPLTATPSSDINTNSRRPQGSSMATTSTRLDPQVAYRSNQMPATNAGGNPSITTPSDPNTNSRSTQGSTTRTTTSIQDAQVVQRPGQMPAVNAGGTPSTAQPQHDGSLNSKRYNSSSTGTTNRVVQLHHSAQDAHHGMFEDQEKGHSGSKRPSRYIDQGGPQGDRKEKILKKSIRLSKDTPTPLYNTNATDGKKPLPSTTTDHTDRGIYPHPSAQAPAVNTDGNPLTATPSSNLNTNSRRPQGSSTATTSTRLDPQVAYRSSQMPATNTGGNPSITTPPSDPNTNSRRTQGPTTTTTTSTRGVQVVQRSGHVPAANAGATSSTAPPQHDGNPSSKGYNSSSTGTTNRGVQPHHSAQDAHHHISEDQEKSYSGSKRLSRYTDQGGQHTQGDEGERRGGVLKKSIRLRKEASVRNTREGQEPQSASSTDSIDVTQSWPGSHSYSLTNQQRRSSSKTTAPPVNVQPQSRLQVGSQHTSYSRALVGGKFQSANHPETGSNASDTRSSDSINSRQTQLGSKSAQSPPPGAAEARPPTANRHRETQPREDASPGGHSTEPPVHVVDDSTDESTQGNDEEPDRSHPQPPGGLSIEERQNVQGEGGESNIAPTSGYFGGIGRIIAGAILGPGGPARPFRDRTKEEFQGTKARLQQLEYEFRRVKGENATLHRTCSELDSENRRNKNTIRSLQHENTDMGRELQEYKNLSSENRRNKDTIQSLERELQVYKNPSYVRGAQVFLTKADLLSISDVKYKVNALNGENFQASASLGDSLVHFRWELVKGEREAAFAEVCKTVSEPVARALVKETQKPEPEVNPLLVQVVLEMYFVYFCSSKIDSWFPGTPETSDFLTTIYSEIRRTGEFIIVRYRSL